MGLKQLGVAAAMAVGLMTSAIAVAGNPLGRYADEETFLPGELAFRASMMSGRNGQVLIHWEMPPGYYLYRDKLKFEASNGMSIRKVNAPAGLLKVDPFLGRVEIYRDSVTVVVDRDPSKAGTLKVAYQGCAEDKICYPPMTRVFAIPGGRCERGDSRKTAAC